ncbi:MAG: hypothetical protein U0Q18_01195 [Bryobacteraceae bacterium]
MFAQLAGLGATGWIVWFASLVPRMDRQPLPVLLAQALEYALMAWAWSATVTICLFLVIPKSERAGLDRRGVVSIGMRTAATAVWFGPATILLTMFSPAAFAAALILVVNATRLLCSEWQPLSAEFRLPGSILPAFVVSVTVQASAVAVLMNYPLLGAALLLMSAAMLTLLVMFAGLSNTGRTVSLPQSILGVLLTVLLAAGLTVGGLPMAISRGPRWDITGQSRPGIFESTRLLLRALFYGESSDCDEGRGPLPVPPAMDEIQVKDTSYPGVILWPEVKPHTILVAPVRVFRPGRLALTSADPQSIPFSGEYWMYKPPMARPPRTSFFRRASPAKLSFITTDHRMMMMEAHHKLDRPLDLRCCGAIQIVISNADRYPGTVSLELLLQQQRLPVPLSLGRAHVTSIPNLRADPAIAASETLTFSVPFSAPLRSFDEFVIRFHRESLRNDRSARIALERFLLVPRGG